METVGGGGKLKVIAWGVGFPVVGCNHIELARDVEVLLLVTVLALVEASLTE